VSRQIAVLPQMRSRQRHGHADGDAHADLKQHAADDVYNPIAASLSASAGRITSLRTVRAPRQPTVQRALLALLQADADPRAFQAILQDAHGARHLLFGEEPFHVGD
jgi:hypothetical protein